MPTDLSFLQVDAFAERPFQGNPAVVFEPGESLDPSRMQDLAREMNVSETCFLVPQGNDFNLRWFTPKVEVDLCGHATLAAAHCLWNEWGYAADTICFHSLSGPLMASKRDGQIWLDFPSESVREIEMPDRLAASLPGLPKSISRNRHDYLAEFGTEEEVRSIRPDFAMLGTLGTRGVIVTSVADKTKGADFVSRYFAPFAGIDEDPVTGSTHCALGPYWSSRLKKSKLTGFQASERGGWVQVHVLSDRVEIGGTAVTIIRGTLCV